MYRVFKETSRRRVTGFEGLISTHYAFEDAVRAARKLARDDRGKRYWIKDSRNIWIASHVVPELQQSSKNVYCIFRNSDQESVNTDTWLIVSGISIVGLIVSILIFT